MAARSGRRGIRGAVDEYRLGVTGQARVAQRLAGHGRCAAEELRRCHRSSTGVRAQDHVRVEHGEQALEITFTRGRQEGIEDLLASTGIDHGSKGGAT